MNILSRLFGGKPTIADAKKEDTFDTAHEEHTELEASDFDSSVKKKKDTKYKQYDKNGKLILKPTPKAEDFADAPAHLQNYVEHFITVSAQGLFDWEYYEKRFGEFESELAAFAHYIDRSYFANVNPSAVFDTETYMRQYQDVYHSGTSPLLHYAYHGREDNRHRSGEIKRWVPSTVLKLKEDELDDALDDEESFSEQNDSTQQDAPLVVDKKEEESTAWKEQKIAIVLHIFYDDFIEKFAASVSRLPLPVDVFITAASDEIAARAKEVFDTIPSLGKLRIASVPNRGRNFGPFLVEFASELLEYDLMCHMHSKKSLYSGREQTQWVDYLHEFLLKDAHTVESILQLFDKHPTLGMYYPTSFWMMPSWVNHWTCNKHFAQPMLEEFGIKADADFLNYPVGGMFWARPSALKPLLEKTFSYEDFPAEPLPNDGSYLHALERVLGLLVEKQGYEQFFYYPPEGSFTQDKSYMFINYTKSARQFFNEVSNFEIASFDVFDTLVNRKYVAPDYAKYRLGEYLAEHDVVASPELFVKLRNDVETQLRIERNHQGDVKLAEVYDAMAQHLGCDLEQAREWSELEFQFDMHGMSGKTEMIQVLNRLSDLGREIWLITDTYYSEQQISMILRHCGLAITFRLFVSSELGLRKDNTSMWQHIRGLVDASEKSFIHIGDSVRSDAQLCGDFGFANMHILHPKDKWLAAGFGENGVTRGDNVKQESMKWGALMSRFGRYPFFGN